MAINWYSQQAQNVMLAAQNAINRGDRAAADGFAQQAYQYAQQSGNANVAAAVVNHANSWGPVQTAGTTETSSGEDSGFDYGAWRKAEDERLAADQEKQRVNAALASMEGFFQSSGLMSLWGGVRKYVEQGYNDSDTIMSILSRDPEYQKAFDNRFPAIKELRAINAQRAAQGLPPRPEPTAAAYVALESGYRNALSGLPDGAIWGTNQDITDWIVNDVSPQEVTDRVTVAKNFINYNTNDFVKQELRSIYGLTDIEMVEYVLDPERAIEALDAQYQKRLSQANVAGGARAQSVGLSDILRDEIAGTQFGSTFDMSSATFKTVSNESKAYERIAALAREEASQADLIREAFGLSGAVEAGQRKKRFASQERSRFSGSSAISNSALKQKQAR